MEHERKAGKETRQGNGHRGASREIEIPPQRPEAMGVVVRDALDHVTVIVRDTAAIVRLQVSDAMDRIAVELRSRAAGLAIAGTCGFVGGVLLLISIFLGLGNIIASVAWRLFLFAVVFLGVAIAGWIVSRRPREERIAEPLRPAAPPERLTSAVALDQESR